MRVAVKLLGFDGFPEVKKDLVDGVVALSLPEEATVEDLLHSLADKYGPVFAPRPIGGAGGLNRVSVFVDNETLDDWQAGLAGALRPHSEISVAFLRPLRGG